MEPEGGKAPQPNGAGAGAEVRPAAALAFNRANAAFRDGNWTEALAECDKALAEDGSLTVASVLRARCLTNLGRLEEARDAYGGVLRTDAVNFSAWLELGNVSRRLGAVERAVQCYENAAACDPADGRGHLAAARALEEMKSPKEVDRAAFHYHRAVVLAGGNTGPRAKAVAGVHHSMGRIRLEAGDAPRALEAMRQASMAVRLAPVEFSGDDLAEIRIDLADALLRLGLTDDAHRVLEKASEAESEAALVRLALLSYRFNLWQEALEILRRNVALRPQSGTAHLNLADMLAKSWQLEEALAELERAEAVGPVPKTASGSMRAYVAGRMGDADTALDLYQQLVDAGDTSLRSSVAMSALYSDTLTPQEVADLHRHLFAPLGAGARSRDSFGNDRDADRPLRIGLVTADLHHQHPVNLFLQPMLACWDRGQYPLTVYFTGTNHDEQTRLAKSRVDVWHEIAPDRLAKQVEADGIDILVDLAGHTSGQNMALFGRRMAPVQATFLGYPGSTGVPNIDWIFGDPVVTPPEHDPLYSEHVARLPDTVFCYAPEVDYPEPAFDGAVADRPLTFGSFNNIPKLTPHTLRLWAEVLKAVPDSRLLLKAPSFKDAGAVVRYTGLFAERGIAADRLEFRGPVGLADMMQEYADVDIGLDPVPYNGGTTTLQAMWMGVPVVVKEGGHFVSRMGASFMCAAGLPEWVAADDAAYVAIAARMAANRQALLDLKRGLRQRLLAQPGWNIEAYTRSFETRLRTMWPPDAA
jgi:predicted O-linked N-acetylglucosamine transferase (SPINDLY family)